MATGTITGPVITSTQITPDPRLSKEFALAQEEARRHMAYGLIAIFGGTIVAGIIMIGLRPSEWADIREFLGIAIAAEIGLLGTVLGFYYAGK